MRVVLAPVAKRRKGWLGCVPKDHTRRFGMADALAELHAMGFRPEKIGHAGVRTNESVRCASSIFPGSSHFVLNTPDSGVASAPTRTATGCSLVIADGPSPGARWDEHWVAELARLLVPGGVLVASVSRWHPDNTMEQLCALLESVGLHAREIRPGAPLFGQRTVAHSWSTKHPSTRWRILADFRSPTARASAKFLDAVIRGSNRVRLALSRDCWVLAVYLGAPESSGAGEAGRQALHSQGRRFDRRLQELLAARADPDFCAQWVRGTPRDREALFRALFPKLAGLTFQHGALDVPPDVGRFRFSRFPEHVIRTPIDWTADPFDNHSWCFWFQSLSWLGRLRTDQEFEGGAHAILDFVERVLFADPPLKWTWNDHALALRLSRVLALFDAHTQRRGSMPTAFVDAVVRIVFTHLYALAGDRLYAPRHNHGLMQDIRVLEQATRFRALTDAPAMADLAQGRLLRLQIDRSVSADGIHVENSPHYHLLYARLATDAMRALQKAGYAIPARLAPTRNALLASLPYLLRPNRTFPQFGDTPSRDRSAELGSLLRHSARISPIPRPILDPLEFVLSGGVRGAPPTECSRVFAAGGYAVFRERWSGDESAVAVHIRFARLGSTHCHQDEQSFELYGHGRSLIVDSGCYSYSPKETLTRYETHARAHSVLIVDEQPYSVQGCCLLLGSASDEHGGWVQVAHPYYRHLGIPAVVRTFAYCRPRTLLVVDSLNAEGPHGYQQLFHLHPTLSGVTAADGVVVARHADLHQPALVIQTGTPTSAVGLVRGRMDVPQGWYFPDQNVAVPATTVVVSYSLGAGAGLLPVLITVVPPDSPAIPNTAFSVRSEGATLVATWIENGRPQHVEFPRPFA
jgi:hypothetical protein